MGDEEVEKGSVWSLSKAGLGRLGRVEKKFL